MEPEHRNFLLAITLTLGIFIVWDLFVIGPQRQALRSQVGQTRDIAPAPAPPELVSRTELVTRQTGQRVSIDGPGVDGSLFLRGARIDDISLRRHFTTVERDTEVQLLAPQGTDGTPWHVTQGWSGGSVAWPGRDSIWTLKEGKILTPQSPVVIEYSADGFSIRRTIELDDNYLFTLTDVVYNSGDVPLTLRPFAVTRQHGLPDDYQSFYILHEGAVGFLGDKLNLLKYSGMRKGKTLSQVSDGGWLALTGKYWMTALIPDQNESITALARGVRDASGNQIYEVRYDGAEHRLVPGDTLVWRGHVFTGAKRVSTLRVYEKQLGLSRFVDAIDWGNFWFFTKPFFWALNFFNQLFGNFGLAILALTVLVKLAFFPLQNTAYASMAKMRKLMPMMEDIRKRFAADKQRQQKEIMALYQREKANPLAGCLPVIPQIFVFYALYKTLFVTLEMRHEPFFGWIRDLSAPDPAHLFNLFGLLPYDPSAVPLIGPIIGIGIWPVLYGLTMWALQALSPPPPDPTQRAILKFLPVVFTFIFAGFAVGLVIYWTWSNVLSLLQQYYIMRRHGVETGFDRLLRSALRRKP